MNNEIILICSPLRFYTQNDEQLCFDWIEKIKGIKKYEGVGRELHLHILSKDISNDDLLDLIGLFDRYKFNADQLKVFMNDQNKEWFE